VLWNGPVLELHTRALARLGPDILAEPPAIDAIVARLGPDILAQPPDFDAMLARLARADGASWLGESLLDQSLVAGIGNMWMAESLWRVRLSPWRRLRDVTVEERRAALEQAASLMRASVDTGREGRLVVYRRAGRPCPRCSAPIAAWGQGDANRAAYWCPRCQVGDDPSVA